MARVSYAVLPGSVRVGTGVGLAFADVLYGTEELSGAANALFVGILSAVILAILGAAVFGVFFARRMRAEITILEARQKDFKRVL